ncbi:hypothetical protein [Microbulbifer variabilis]|uniref:DUF2946 domain-containing protein n=1 Tax=Microbulbifer variabilis TaxID=266805 RepID=A0ABY4VAS2_9GAMM|nr:hypothetical protein [Microbulbifer variabilis]USD21376.1 hypothetical protein MJO52_20340 [Microbulbifer variabilis]
MRGMVTLKRRKSHYWASLFLLLALVAAQPLWAEHFHLGNSQVELCDLCCMHSPAALGSEPLLVQAEPQSHCNRPSALAARDRQPERQSARAPPLSLSLS